MALNRHTPWLRVLILATVFGLTLTAAQAQPASLSGPQGTLTLDARGLSLAPSSADCPAIAAQGGPLWTMVLMKPATPPKIGETWIITSASQKPRQEAGGDAIRLVYDKVTDGKKTWKIGFTLEIRRQGDAFQIGGELRNNEKSLLVRELNCPLLGGIQAGASKAVLLYPNGLGQRFITGDKPAEFSFYSPAAVGTMQWCTFAGERGGLYVGSHDDTHGAKRFSFKYTPQGRQFNLRVMHFVIFLHPGARWALPPLVIRPYSGSWHAAAKIYRAWYDAATPRPQAPEWAKNASGWLLCILRQQNGELMWDYPSLSKLCDVADARGIDILGLFGWTAAGHDHLYPEYIADPKMGGPEGLRKVLAEVHRRGKRAIIYVNGQLIARGTEYWRTQGKDEAIIKANGEYLSEVWQKYKTFPAQEFGIACHYAKGWEATMLAQAMQAHELGADGILYDQLGGGSRTCYATHHGHLSPASVYTEDRRGMLRRIADHMRKIDPNFILMTEGLDDLLLDSISIFHGCVNGVFTITPAEILSRIQQTKPSATFPEMFRYTFPEVMTTIRQPTPMLDRAMANYTCVYGMRNEIETRYAPDVRYLKEDVVPTRQDYRDILSPPNVEMMQATPPAEATHYLKQVIDFTRAHADLFWRGRFVDVEGFKFEGEKMMAKGYAAGGRLGVVVWNPTDRPATFKLEVPGANLESAAEPGKAQAEAFGELGPQSIRLLVWQKK